MQIHIVEAESETVPGRVLRAFYNATEAKALDAELREELGGDIDYIETTKLTVEGEEPKTYCVVQIGQSFGRPPYYVRELVYAGGETYSLRRLAPGESVEAGYSNKRAALRLASKLGTCAGVFNQPALPTGLLRVTPMEG